MPTIKDVAKLAGVGVGTASRVLSGTGSFSADAAARVESAVKTLGFRPSVTARALSLRSTGTLGVYVADFMGSFYGPMLAAIDLELRRHDRHMVAVNGHGGKDPREQAAAGAQFLIDRECDGIIIATNALRDADLTELKHRYPRLALVNRDVKGMRSVCFSADHRHAGHLAAQALVGHGHRDIAVLTGPTAAPDNRQRMGGFYDELARHGIAEASVQSLEADFSPQSGWDGAAQLIERGRRFTGLFCANDQMAMAAMSYLQGRGIRVPGDISVVGYDGAEFAAYTSPRLATVNIPIAAMGLNACRLLMNQCWNSGMPVETAFVPELVLRESLGPAPR